MKYFNINEFCSSRTAEKYHVLNVPSEEEKENIIRLVENVLDPIREQFGEPIFISSGYRSNVLNKLVGGVRNSQHTRGEAADIVSHDMKRLCQLVSILAKHKLVPFDQIIFEKPNLRGIPRWIHISFTVRRKNRFEVLTIH